MENQILLLAEKLGKEIHQSPQASALREAKKQLDQHKDVLDNLQAYQEHMDKVQALEHENKPIEVADKHKLQELHDKLVANDIFKKYTAAQVEYVDLMRKVNNTLRKELAQTES